MPSTGGKPNVGTFRIRTIADIEQFEGTPPTTRHPLISMLRSSPWTMVGRRTR